MKWRLVGSALLVVAALSSAGAQQASQGDPLYKFDTQTRLRIETLIDSARQDNLPANAIRLKAIEYAAKKLKSKDALDGLRRLYRSLEQSRAALGPNASSDDIEAGASVLDAGVKTEDLARFRVASPARSPMRPLTYLTAMISQHNVPRAEAVEVFAKLWKDGAADSDFDGLWRAVDQDILGGLNPGQAFQMRVRAMPAKLTRPPGEA
jgi:hypothetical protein